MDTLAITIMLSLIHFLLLSLDVQWPVRSVTGIMSFASFLDTIRDIS